jgi:DNA-binding NtrC family response regulator
MGMTYKIMVVDDEKNMRELLCDLLEMEGFRAEAAADGESALAMARDRAPDLMVLDLRLPGIQGMQVLRMLREEGAGFPVVIITAHGDINTAVEALKAGAADFIVKPFDNERLLASIRQALEAQGVVAQAGMSRPRLIGGVEIVGESREILDVFEMIDKIARTAATVLIRGESGTGKELIAQAVHLKSDRKDAPMVSLNCAALPETLLESELFGYERGAFTGAHQKKAGRIELAHGGTLFLDEVGDLSLSAQAKLLRVLDEKEFSPLGSERTIRVDIRVIAATNRDLEAMVKAGSFREDLFFRLNVVPVYLPPLRERKEDIAALAKHFLDKYAKRHAKQGLELDEETMARLSAYPWPGNIRELEHAIEKYVILGELPIPEVKDTDYKPVPLAEREEEAAGQTGVGVGPLKKAMKAAEREVIIRTLKHTGGAKKAAADILKVSYKTLFNKIHEHGIEIKAEIK